MMTRRLLAVGLFLAISGCAATRMDVYRVAGRGALCAGGAVGVVAVLPEAAWRPDQKEPEKREAMALAVLRDVFRRVPCGTTAAPRGVKRLATWSAMPEARLLDGFRRVGVDTVVIVRLEELTPRLAITFSCPSCGPDTAKRTVG